MDHNAGSPRTTAPSSPPARSYKYFSFVMTAFVVVLLCSNMIGPGKSCAIDVGAKLIPDLDSSGQLILTSLLVFGAGNLFFPFSYIFGDILTEVYGYARSRKVIWAGFAALLFYVIMSQVVIRLPQNPNEPYNKIIQPAIEVCFGNGWRIVAASMFAFWVGDFANSFVMAKLKILTNGRMLWTRTIGSTIVGQGFDSLLFYPIAFAGLWESSTLIKIAIFNWVFKVMVEVLMTPLTYLICNWLKKAEGEDYFDRDTNFTPFSLSDK